MDNSVIIYQEVLRGLPERFEEKIRKDLDYLIEKRIPGLRSIYLFGSCARGEARSTSDVDLLIITEKKMEDRMLAAQIRWTLDEPLRGVRTDVVFKNEETLQNSETQRSVFENALFRDRKLILEVKR